MNSPASSSAAGVRRIASKPAARSSSRSRAAEPSENRQPQGSVSSSDPSASAAPPPAAKARQQRGDKRHGSQQPGDDNAIRVVVRIRPFSAAEVAAGKTQSWLHVADDRGVPEGSPGCAKPCTVSVGGAASEERKFVLDRVFGTGCTQQEVYDEGAAPIVDAVLEGFNGTVLAYGQTGTGKSYTMEGKRSPKSPTNNQASSKGTQHRNAGTGEGSLVECTDVEAELGVIPRMIGTVFDYIEKADPTVEFQLKLSICEIYMEKIRDLLFEGDGPREPGAPPPLRISAAQAAANNLPIRQDPVKGIYIEGLTECYVTSPHDIMECIAMGQANRAVSVTNMNAHSSRSHLMVILTVSQKDKSEAKVGKLFLVDLAGSEKVAKSGAEGLTFEEAKMINKSLSALGNVINALTSAPKGKASHVPYRTSKLTRAIQESLGGNSKTCLICTASPSEIHDSESLSTLRFGQRAKLIKNAAHVNQELTVDEMKSVISRSEAKLILQARYIAMLRHHCLRGGLGVLPLPGLLAAADTIPPKSPDAYDILPPDGAMDDAPMGDGHGVESRDGEKHDDDGEEEDDDDGEDSHSPANHQKGGGSADENEENKSPLVARQSPLAGDSTDDKKGDGTLPHAVPPSAESEKLASAGDATVAADIPTESSAAKPEEEGGINQQRLLVAAGKTQKLSCQIDQLTQLYHKVLSRNADLKAEVKLRTREVERREARMLDLKRQLDESRDMYGQLLEKCSELTSDIADIHIPRYTRPQPSSSSSSTSASASTTRGADASASSNAGENESTHSTTTWASPFWASLYGKGNQQNSGSSSNQSNNQPSGGFSFAGFAPRKWLNITKPLKGGGAEKP